MIRVDTKQTCCPECKKKISIDHITQASLEEYANEVSDHDVHVSKIKSKTDYSDGIDFDKQDKWKTTQVYTDEEDDEFDPDFKEGLME